MLPPSIIMRTNAAAEDFNLEISEDLIAQPTPVPSSTVPLSFASILDPPLKLRTNQAECGGQLWPAGMVLAEYILWHKLEYVRGRKMSVRPNANNTCTYRAKPILSELSLELEAASLGEPATLTFRKMGGNNVRQSCGSARLAADDHRRAKE